MQQVREDLRAYAEHFEDSCLPEWQDECVDFSLLLELALDFQLLLKATASGAMNPSSSRPEPEPEPEVDFRAQAMQSVSYTAGFNFVDNPSSGAQQQQQNGSIYDDAATAAEDSRKITVVPSATAPTAMDSDHPFGLVDGSSSFIVYSFDISIDSEVVHTIKGRFSDLRAQHSKLGEILEHDIDASRTHSSSSHRQALAFPSRLTTAAPLQITTLGGLGEAQVAERSRALCRYYIGLLEDSDGRILRQVGEHKIKELHSALGLAVAVSERLLGVSRRGTRYPAAAALSDLLREAQRQADAPAAFCAKQMQALRDRTAKLAKTMADLDEAESAAGAGVVDVSFKAERKVTLKACRSLYHGVELLEDFALTNAEALGQVAKFVDRSCQAHAGGGESALSSLSGIKPNAGMAFLRDCPPLLELRAAVQTGSSELSDDLRALLQQQLSRGEGSAGAVTSADEFLKKTTTKKRAASTLVVFGFGFTAGFCLCLSIVIAHLFTSVNVWEPRYLFFSWRPHLQVCLCLWLWGLNILVFQKYGINHVLVLGLSPHPEKYLHASSLMWCAAIWSILSLCGFWLQVSNAWVYLTDEPESPPIVVWSIVLGFMVLPTQAEWSLWTSRRRIWRTFMRVLGAGWVPVLWRDVLLANILSSLVKPLVDINHSVCFSLTETFFEEGQRLESLTQNVPIDECGCLPGFGYDHVSQSCLEGNAKLNASEVYMWCNEDNGGDVDLCTEYFTLDAVVTFLPYYFRFAQQVRRYIDSGFTSKRDLVNAGKYSTSLAVVTLSWMDHTYTSRWTDGKHVDKWDIGASPIKTAWAVMVLICAVYKLIWDVKQDWKLGESTAPHKFLRNRLTYPPWFYYYAMAQDACLRFTWALTISPSFFKLNNVSDLWLSTAFATLEVVRRFTWTLIRVEAEHVTNVGKQRAFADVPLPSIDRARLAATQNWYGEDIQQVGKGGVRKRKRGKKNGAGNLRAELMATTTVT